MSKFNLTNMTRKVVKGSMLFPVALMLMGNSQCSNDEQSVVQRELRRRVQLGAIEAPPMKFSDGSQFDFGGAANAQMYGVLNSTKSFSGASVPPGNLDTSTMSPKDKEAFYQCEDGSGNSNFLSQEAACMVHMPLARLNGKITNFQVTNASGGGINFFLDTIGVGLSFKSTKARLSMELKADHPLIINNNIAASSPSSISKEFEFNANISYGQFGINAGNYSKSDLAQVVKTALTQGIGDLKTEWDKKQPWHAMVLKNCDKAIMINAGDATDAGLMEGDVLEVYNTRYEWEGDVCASQLNGEIDATAKPIAVVQVEIVGNTFSQARIIEQTADKILPGARVYVRRLIEPAQ